LISERILNDNLLKDQETIDGELMMKYIENSIELG
jgi:uncharacterized membrane protein YgaE (UPF0421/DUF939 family)